LKLASFIYQNKLSYGIVRGDQILDLKKIVGEKYPDSKAFLQEGNLGDVSNDFFIHNQLLNIDEVRLRPVILGDIKLFCARNNSITWAQETGADISEHPDYYIRDSQTLLGHNESITQSYRSSRLGFEADLCMVIGLGGSNIPKNSVKEHIAGYTCILNGFSFPAEKNPQEVIETRVPINAFTSIGPWMVTSDEVDDVAALSIEGRLNGEVIQDSLAGELIHDVNTLVSFISQHEPLSVGDMISIGSSVVVGHTDENDIEINPGDLLEVDITRVGILRNSVAT